MTVDELNALMAEAGPLEDSLLAILQIGDADWVLRFAESDVEATFVEAEQRLVFSVSVGQAPAGRECAVYKALLTYNYIWRDTGSVRMALDGLEDEIVMMADLSGGRITARNVANVAVNMADRAEAFGLIVAAGAPSEAAPFVAGASEATFRI